MYQAIIDNCVCVWVTNCDGSYQCICKAFRLLAGSDAYQCLQTVHVVGNVHCYDAEDDRAQHRDAAKVHELHISIFSLQVADAQLVASCKSCLHANKQICGICVCAI